MKDALDTVKYTLRKFLFDDEHRNEQAVHQQECSWKKLFTTNVHTPFKQHVGERLFNISKTVIVISTIQHFFLAY